MAVLPGTLSAGLVELRCWRSGDLDALLDALIVSLPELRVWMPWAQETPRPDAYTRVLQEFEEHFDAGTEFVFGMFDPTGIVVGGCGLHFRPGPGAVEIGYWVRTDCHRRGYATAAAAALTTAAFRHLPEIDEVHILMDRANVASAGVPRKLGFRLDGSIDRVVPAPGRTGCDLRWVMDRAGWAVRPR